MQPCPGKTEDSSTICKALSRGCRRQNPAVAEEVPGEHCKLRSGEQVLKHFNVLATGAAIGVWTDRILAGDCTLRFGGEVCRRLSQPALEGPPSGPRPSKEQRISRLTHPGN